MSYKPKSSRQLYRDCLRLIKHMAGGTSPKAIQMRVIVAAQFRANKDVTDPAQLHALKQTCVAAAPAPAEALCSAARPAHARRG